MRIEFPSWHIMEVGVQGNFSAFLFLDESSYNVDQSDDAVHEEYSMDGGSTLIIHSVWEDDYAWEDAEEQLVKALNQYGSVYSTSYTN